MACNFLCRSLLIISSLLVVTMSESNPTCSSPFSPSSPPPSSYINIFEALLVTDPNIHQTLTSAPFVQGMDTSTPAYEFTGHGTGFAVTSMSSKIREMSCRHNEVTFSGRVFIRDSQSDGPLLELSYGGNLFTGRVVYLITMDAAADEIIIGYKHQGKLHSETIAPVRLISGRWRDYTITLSGNLLTFYFDCQLMLSRVVPLPDYCANDSSVVLNVASSISGAVEYAGNTGLYMYAQNFFIHFGPGGLQRQCPNLADECFSCGQFLSLLEHISEAQDRMDALQTKIDKLENNSNCTAPSSTSPTPITTNCLVMDGSRPQMLVNDGEFLFIPPNRICYCDNGREACTNIEDVNVNTPAPNCPGSSTSEPVPSNPTQPTQPPPGTVCPDPPGITVQVPVDGVRSRRVGNGICDIYTCKDEGRFGLNLLRDRYDCAMDVVRPSNCSDLSQENKELFRCCGFCDACSFKTCSANSVCMIQDNPEVTAVCMCNTGFIMSTESEECIDIDECTLGLRPEGHNCPLETSTCINTEGSFRCRCKQGYAPNVITGNCEDVDECANNSTCGSFGICTNSPGSYSCSCRPGYAKLLENEDCQPVCDPGCLNGGVCLSPGTCACPPQFSGTRCENDVNECEDPAICPGNFSECVNTIGGHFCRCLKGFYHDDNGNCANVDECSLRINNCVGGATCLDTVGGFRCMCEGPLKMLVECTGHCVRTTTVGGVKSRKVFVDGESDIDRCRNCTCLGGELTCRRLTCNCSDPQLANSGCCSECTRRDCYIKNNTVSIRPGSTWINPSNRCERYHCLQNLTAVAVSVDDQCPELNCPKSMQTLPMGKCCPVCNYPPCGPSLQGHRISLRNGCEQCVCMNSSWSCSNQRECPVPNCEDKDIVFYKDCCPVCRQDVLGRINPTCPT